jgi:hypothetical protein
LGSSKIDEAQAVFVSGSLPQEELAFAELAERFRGQRVIVDAVSPGVNDVVGIFRQVCRVLFNLRHKFVALDFEGHVPRRSKQNRFDFTFKDRRLVVIGAADHDVHRVHDVVLGVADVQAEFRNIHHDGRARKTVGQPPPSFKGQLQLKDALRKRDIEFANGRWVKQAAGIEAVAFLEPLDRFGELFVVNGGGGSLHVRQVADQLEQVAQARNW